MNQRKLTQ